MSTIRAAEISIARFLHPKLVTALHASIGVKMKRKPQEGARDLASGYVYVASNPLMPGLVKVGRTRGAVEHRLRSLYSTGVPGPFKNECARFFIDCCEGETSMHRTLAENQCDNREFFAVEAIHAVRALENLYKSQHDADDLWIFELSVEATFLNFLSKGSVASAIDLFDTLGDLPDQRRKELELTLLGSAIIQGNEGCAIWLVRNRNVDPEEPIRNAPSNMNTTLYDFTAFEYSILFGLSEMEACLTRTGCDISTANTLCVVIDALINGPQHYDLMSKLTRFAIKLIQRGVNVHKRLHADLFRAAARRSTFSGLFRFDIFPRNSNMSCQEIAFNLAPDNAWFWEIYQAMPRAL